MIIKIQDNTKEALEKMREHRRETWDDLIQKLLPKTSDKDMIPAIKQEVENGKLNKTK